MKESSIAIERRAAKALRDLFATIPTITIGSIEREAVLGKSASRADVVAMLSYPRHERRIAIEVKPNGQPRVVRDAARQLKRSIEDAGIDAVPMVIAPYLSAQAQRVCLEEEVGYLDFLGNTHLAFDTVYIDRAVEGRPEPEKRALRSLFKPKSARILRTLLRDPPRRWRVVDLAEDAQVSLGMVSTIGAALRERGWAEQGDEGLHLLDPNGLLDAWAVDYEPPRGEEVRLYTHLHGRALTERLRTLGTDAGAVVLASYTAAEWLAPFARHGTSYFYADEQGLDGLRDALSLKDTERGANVVVRIPDDDGVLLDALPFSDGLRATSPVQTYLDLSKSGERGEEAAQHLRANLLRWSE